MGYVKSFRDLEVYHCSGSCQRKFLKLLQFPKDEMYSLTKLINAANNQES